MVDNGNLWDNRLNLRFARKGGARRLHDLEIWCDRHFGEYFSDKDLIHGQDFIRCLKWYSMRHHG